MFKNNNPHILEMDINICSEYQIFAIGKSELHSNRKTISGKSHLTPFIKFTENWQMGLKDLCIIF